MIPFAQLRPAYTGARPIDSAPIVDRRFPDEGGQVATAFTNPIPHGEWETRDDAGDKKREKESAEWRNVTVKMKVVQSTVVP